MLASAAGNLAQSAQKDTAVDSVNSSIENLTARVGTLSVLAMRIADGIVGYEPQSASATADKPQPVRQSTQDHIRELEATVERLGAQLNRLT